MTHYKLTLLADNEKDAKRQAMSYVKHENDWFKKLISIEPETKRFQGNPRYTHRLFTATFEVPKDRITKDGRLIPKHEWVRK